MEQVNTSHVILKAVPQQHMLAQPVSRGEGLQKEGAVILGLGRFLFISEVTQWSH